MSYILLNERVHAEADAPLMKRLIESGAEIVCMDLAGWTPLHYAARFGTQAGCIAVIVNAGADVEVVTVAGETPLHIAARAGNQVAAEGLIAAGAQVNLQDRKGNTPLHLACGCDLPAYPNLVSLVETLLNAGAYVKAEKYPDTRLF